ncbi:MAG: HlyD family efflux transporter periplasmic adaptor subunit [Gammaproteobacteria bacterium]|nr:HlyD family efflux transporter periplasmic adaptor subunit [Gammaproteobacteria bacterium]
MKKINFPYTHGIFKSRGRSVKIVKWSGVACAILLLGCSKHSDSQQGYVDADYLYVSSYVAGKLESLRVNRGDSVKAGQLLYTLEQDPEADDLASAIANTEEAQAKLSDLLTGERPSELATIQAQIEQAEAQLEFDHRQLVRSQYLVKTNNLEQAQLDQDLENEKVSLGKINELKNTLMTANLPARVQQIEAARSALNSAYGALARAQWMLSQTETKAPVSGLVFDVYHWPGEEIGVQIPVLSILDPTRTKVVFFVPEAKLASLKIGQTVSVSCEGCQSVGHPVIRYISPQAEYTPPVIYSREQSSKLVYRIEAYFEAKTAFNWHPGQPVTVSE